MKEIDFKSNLMRHYYQTGNIVQAKEIHKKLTAKPGQNGAEGDAGLGPEFSGGEDTKD